MDDLRRVHEAAYLDAILAQAPRSGLLMLDEDTYMSPGSLNAARRAAGSVVQAVRDVAAGRRNGRSAPSARRAIMPNRTGRWASASSPISRWRRGSPSPAA
jgi:acetoin utilization deacetylase AcuC-like enzyme